MGAGYHGGFGRTEGSRNKPNYTIDKNVQGMKKYYPVTETGKFGVKGKNQRIIYSKDQFATAEDFFERIARGGEQTKLPNGKGIKSVLSDGTTIVYRVITSTASSPAVEIFISQPSSIVDQKIHFIKEE